MTKILKSLGQSASAEEMSRRVERSRARLAAVMAPKPALSMTVVEAQIVVTEARTILYKLEQKARRLRESGKQPNYDPVVVARLTYRLAERALQKALEQKRR